jgi:hypothetical protein
MRTEQRSHGRVATSLGCWLALSVLSLPAMAQVVVTDSGQPSYSYAIKVPPGAGGFVPQIALVYDGSSMGVLGKGWRIEGIPSVARCQPTRSVDGASGVVMFSANDKLCLNGERLIQTNDRGDPLLIPQSNDASVGREYRTERDKLLRVRSFYDQIVQLYDPNAWSYDGPAYFRVWMRDGRVQTLRASLNQYTLAAVVPKPSGGKALVAWPYVSETDRAGNVINYTSGGWGQFFVPGTIGYNGTAPNSQYSPHPLNNTSIVFNYEQLDDAYKRTAYYRGSANLLTQRVASVDIKAAPDSVARRLVLSYSGNLLSSIKECAGPTFAQCLPATTFSYASGSGYSAGAALGYSATGDRLLGDFNGDGRTDLVLLEPYAGSGPVLWLGGHSQQQISGGESIKRSNNPLVVDFDGDGLDDILLLSSNDVWTCSNCSLIYRSNGNGTFSRQPVRFSGGANFQLARKPGAITVDYGPHPKVSGYENFVLGDFNADGRIDIVRVSGSGTYVEPGQGGVPGLDCTFGGCQFQLLIGNGDGSFSASTVSAPAIPYIGVSSDPLARDLNADGIPDLAYGSASETATDTRYPANWGTRTTTVSFKRGYFAGRIAGNFEVDVISTDPQTGQQTVGGMQPECSGAGFEGDFNGDGLPDSGCFVNGALTVHTWTGTQYVSQSVSMPYTSVIGVADFDGDGRADFLSSNSGISAFRIGSQGQMVSLGGFTGPYNGIKSFRTGNFTGKGRLEFLIDSTAESGGVTSQLFVRDDPIPAGTLLSVTEPSGAITTLTYEGLAGTARHASDRATAYASVYPLQEPGARSLEIPGPSKMASFRVVDTVPPTFVVTKITSDTGVGTAKTTTELAYRGFKSDLLGRGALGFREIRRQTDAPDGTSKLTTVQQRLQTYPYTGAVSVNENYLGPLSPIGEVQAGLKLSRTENTYCDVRAAAGAEASATVTAPCPVTSKVLRPYARKTVQSAWDLNGTALPVTTTTNTYTGGYPTLIEVQTVGSSPAGTQTFVSSTANEYFADSIGGDNWLLGLLKKSTVTKTVPNSLGAITTSAGTAPKAAATAGP